MKHRVIFIDGSEVTVESTNWEFEQKNGWIDFKCEGENDTEITVACFRQDQTRAIIELRNS